MFVRSGISAALCYVWMSDVQQTGIVYPEREDKEFMDAVCVCEDDSRVYVKSVTSNSRPLCSAPVLTPLPPPHMLALVSIGEE